MPSTVPDLLRTASKAAQNAQAAQEAARATAAAINPNAAPLPVPGSAAAPQGPSQVGATS